MQLRTVIEDVFKDNLAGEIDDAIDSASTIPVSSAIARISGPEASVNAGSGPAAEAAVADSEVTVPIDVEGLTTADIELPQAPTAAPMPVAAAVTSTPAAAAPRTPAVTTASAAPTTESKAVLEEDVPQRPVKRGSRLVLVIVGVASLAILATALIVGWQALSGPKESVPEAVTDTGQGKGLAADAGEEPAGASPASAEEPEDAASGTQGEPDVEDGAEVTADTAEVTVIAPPEKKPEVAPEKKTVVAPVKKPATEPVKKPATEPKKPKKPEKKGDWEVLL